MFYSVTPSEMFTGDLARLEGRSEKGEKGKYIIRVTRIISDLFHSWGRQFRPDLDRVQIE